MRYTRTATHLTALSNPSLSRRPVYTWCWCRAKEAGDAAFYERDFQVALVHYAEALKLDTEWDAMNAVLHCNRYVNPAFQTII